MLCRVVELRFSVLVGGMVAFHVVVVHDGIHVVRKSVLEFLTSCTLFSINKPRPELYAMNIADLLPLERDQWSLLYIANTSEETRQL